jgi:hypothetical protein
VRKWSSRGKVIHDFDSNLWNSHTIYGREESLTLLQQPIRKGVLSISFEPDAVLTHGRSRIIDHGLEQ